VTPTEPSVLLQNLRIAPTYVVVSVDIFGAMQCSGQVASRTSDEQHRVAVSHTDLSVSLRCSNLMQAVGAASCSCGCLRHACMVKW
jgi:hypothetical protein